MRRNLLATMALLLVWAAAARAHHSAAPFDTTKTQTITGTVKQLQWTNPHTWVWVDVPNGRGGIDTWGIEGMSPNYLARRGWSKNTLKVGDKITVDLRPMKDGSPGGMFVQATLADGKVMKMTGEPTEP
jgi:hypothetical protein